MKKGVVFFWASVLIFSVYSSSFSVDIPVLKPTVMAHGVFHPVVVKKCGDEASSDNGRFWSKADVEVLNGGLYYRKLDFYEGDKVIYSLYDLPGTSITISNSGYMICGRETSHENGSFDLTFYSKEGKMLFTKHVEYTGLFSFSSAGNAFVVGDAQKCEVVSLPSGNTDIYPFAMEFDVSPDETLVALGNDKVVNLCLGGKVLATIEHGIPFFRGVKLSPDKNHVGFYGKNELFVYSTGDLSTVIEDRIDGVDNGFMDLRLSNTTVWAGIHERNRDHTLSTGVLRTYDLTSRKRASEEVGAVRTYEPVIYKYTYESKNGLPQIPWPLDNQNVAYKPWNSYLLLSNASDGTSGQYLHQGLDLDVPTGIMTRSVEDGYVKAVLTKGGDIYWRVAVSDVQVSGASNAWLFAHLIQSTIAVKVGDQVKKGDPIGGVIAWSGLSGGHLHFSRIKGTGTTWTDWASWANLLNPLLCVVPKGETNTPPTIETADATNSSKFAFSTNDGSGSATYVKPNNLSGDVDIVVKVTDKYGNSQWTQGATFIYYTIQDANGTPIVPRKMALCRNQSMPDYDGNLYYTLVNVMYRVDSKFTAYGWFTQNRHYGHVITNSKGDSALALADKSLALKTKSYPDGKYKVIVEVYDADMNKSVDSQEVTFNNGNPSYIISQEPVREFRLNYSSVTGANSHSVIRFQVPHDARVALEILDMKGRVIKDLLSDLCPAGRHSVEWNGTDNAGAPVHAGTYLCTFKAEKYWAARRIVVQH